MKKAKSKWIVFDKKGKRVKTVTLTHEDNHHYKEIKPFEENLKEKGLYAHSYESVNQEFLQGKTFRERLILLGWTFDSNGNVSSGAY